MKQLSGKPVSHIIKGIPDQLPLDLTVMGKMRRLKGNLFLRGKGADPLGQSLSVIFAVTDPDKKGIFNQIAQEKEGTVQQKLQKRHIFVIQINTVAGGQLYLEGIIFGTTGSAAYMKDQGGGTVAVLISVDPCTISDVNILQIGEVAFIKESDTLKGISAVDGGSGAGGKDNIRFAII